MSNNFSLDQLTEGIRQRHLGSQNRQLVEKWARTGLLRGLEGVKRENMARLLENQASQVLREQNSISTGGSAITSSGDLRGFTNVAFPIVRRVFGGLVANELVSIQPMSLPSGLLFYLDYTYGTNQGSADGQGTGPDVGTGEAYSKGDDSIYGNPAGSGIRSGSLAVGGQYNLAGSGYSRVHSTAKAVTVLASGSYQGSGAWTAGKSLAATGSDGKLLQFDPQITNAIENNAMSGTTSGMPGGQGGNGSYYALILDTAQDWASGSDLTLGKEFAAFGSGVNVLDTAGQQFPGVGSAVQGGRNVINVRRLNQMGTWTNNSFTPNALITGGTSGTANGALLMIVSGCLNSKGLNAVALTDVGVSYPLSAQLNSADGSTLVIPAFESNFGSTPSPAIPEIDIKIQSVAVVAETRKLRARWSPELAQDLNAYHSLDAEVELTQILSEQVAIELDREILNDLLTGANGANLYWSRAPGKFVNKETGAEILASSQTAPGPAFTGTVREWYETLVETMIDVANTIHRKTLRGAANFIVVGPDVATVLESSVLYRPDYTLDGDGQVGSPFSIGCEKAGTLSNRFTVYKDPYFPRNKVLVGYKGGSYLETGYVYAPYVPLIVTPTIFAPEDFTPRKGVMTRYGKKMVRSDFYGTVTVLDMNVI
tara:strand:- start:10414 stop:12375 length:1962 start_codon:yes stop_codon:yes gene_type:complete